MNKQLHPASLRVRPSGSFMFDYRKDGKTVRKGLGKDLEIAYERAVIMRREIDSLPVVSNRKVTLDQWYEAWSPKRFASLSPTTVDGYRYCWQALPDDLKNTLLDKLTSEKIRLAVTTCDKPSMQGHAGAFLSTLLNAAVKAGLLPKSPWQYTDTRHKKVVHVLSADDLVKVFEAATDSAKVGLVLAGFCGLRRGEIMGLKVGDIDLDQQRIYIRGARIKVFGKNGSEHMKGTKTDTPRVVPVPDVALELIRSAIEGKGKDVFLYPTFRNDLHTRLKTACRKVGVPELTLHELRHICGSNLMMTGGVALAQAVLGHKDITTTVDTYGHLSSIYLAAQVNLSHLPVEKLARFALMAETLKGHTDPDVQEFAREALQVCHYLSPGTKKGLTESP